MRRGDLAVQPADAADPRELSQPNRPVLSRLRLRVFGQPARRPREIW